MNTFDGLAQAISAALEVYRVAYRDVMDTRALEIRAAANAKQAEVQIEAEAAGLAARDAYFAANPALLAAVDAFNAT